MHAPQGFLVNVFAATHIEEWDIYEFVSATTFVEEQGIDFE